MGTVFIRAKLPEHWLTELAGCELTDQGLEHADAIFSLLTERIDVALLERAPGLKVVSNMAVGVDNVDVAACTERGIPVGTTPGVLTDATADLAWGLILAAARGLPQAVRDAREGRWKTWSPTGWLGIDLHGAVLGIVGMGKIGRAVAERARGFGTRILYATRSNAQAPGTRVELAELLARADIVSLHVPLTDQTRGLIGASELAAMKPGSILVNTARGPIVDLEALADAAVHLRAAALDVTDPEPLSPDHRLYRLPNVIISPHIGSATEGTRKRMAELACRNIVAALGGKRLEHCVNPEVYS